MSPDPLTVPTVPIVVDNNQVDLDTIDPLLDANVDYVAGLAEAVISKKAVHSAWVDTYGKKVRKATVMRLYSDPFAISNSQDRLKRARLLPVP